MELGNEEEVNIVKKRDSREKEEREEHELTRIYVERE